MSYKIKSKNKIYFYHLYRITMYEINVFCFFCSAAKLTTEDQQKICFVTFTKELDESSLVQLKAKKNHENDNKLLTISPGAILS